MSSAEAITGQLRWRMLADEPQLLNERPDWVGRVAPGRSGAELPGVLAALFSMCAHAHRLTATHAVQAAQGLGLAWGPASQRALQLETLREHLRRLWLEWPRLLWDAELPPHGVLELAHCPVLRPDRREAAAGASLEAPDAADAVMQELRAWLQQHVFGTTPAQWLGAWQAAGETSLVAWADTADTWPARLLKRVRPLAKPVRLPCRPLRIDVQGIEQDLAAWAAELACLPGASRAPLWQQAPAETGPWTRLHGQDADRCAAEPSLWWRMGARLADMARLALPDSETDHHGRHALQAGALTLPKQGAVAWTETARGLLMHWVQLEASPAGQAPKVRACQVVSPTEWNFHAQGQAARALQEPTCASLPERLRLIPAVLAAYDPCVPVQIDACDGSPLMRFPPAPISTPASTPASALTPAPQPKPQDQACTN